MSRWFATSRIRLANVSSVDELALETKHAFKKTTAGIKLKVKVLKLKGKGTLFAISNPKLIEELSNNKARLRQFRLHFDGTFRIMPSCGDKNGQFVTVQVCYQKQVFFNLVQQFSKLFS